MNAPLDTTKPETAADTKRAVETLVDSFWHAMNHDIEQCPLLLEELLALDPEEGAALAAVTINSIKEAARRPLCRSLVEHDAPALTPHITQIYTNMPYNNADPEARRILLRAAFARDNHKRWTDIAGWARNDPDWGVRYTLARAIEPFVEDAPEELIIQLLLDIDNDVKFTAQEAFGWLSPDKKQRCATTIALTSQAPETVSWALNELSNVLGLEATLALVEKQAIHAQRGTGACEMIAFRHQHTALDDREWHKWLWEHPDAMTRGNITQWAAEMPSFRDTEWFERVMNEGTYNEQCSAFKGLLRCQPDTRRERLIEGFQHKDELFRARALQSLQEDDHDAELLDVLLPLSRDPAYQVRQAALEAISRYDEPRARTELLSCLDDRHHNVRERAKELLEERMSPPLSAWSHFDKPHPATIGQPWWYRIRYRIALLHHWARMVGRELLGVPIKVHPYREGLGRTWTTKPGEPIDIEISDTPVTSGHIFGTQIMKGLVLHELGHHLFDIHQRGHRAMRGIARSEGLRDLHAIVIDERLERAMRSRRPRWGVYFDRLASYAFAQNTYKIPIAEYAALLEREEDEISTSITVGELPGYVLPPSRRQGHPMVALRERDLLAIPGAINVHTAFLWCLRCGFDPKQYHDPRVAEAIELIPSNLKDISQAEVLQVVRQLGDLLGRGECLKRERAGLMERFANCPSIGKMARRVMGRMDDNKLLPKSARREDGAHACRESRLEEINIVYERPEQGEQTPTVGQTLNLGSSLDFPSLSETLRLAPDPIGFKDIVAPIRPHVRNLRGYFERLGMAQMDEYASRRGRRLDIVQARKSAAVSIPNLLIHSRTEIAPNLYMGLLIDRSGSMSGEGLERAKSFAALLLESVRGLRGIEGHVNAFDCTHFVELGDFQRNGIARLETYGGNNDAAALERAASLALQSGKQCKLLIMISDGSPTQCSVNSLRRLVQRLTRLRGIICAQVAVASLPEIAFPHYVDLSAYHMDEAVSRFGRMLIRLTSHWR